MEPAFDSFDAYRKLEKSGVPEPQAGATVEIVNDAMQNLVTKEYLTAELDRRFGEVDRRFGEVDRRFGEVEQRFTKLEAKVDTSVAELGRSQARGLLAMSAINIAIASLLFMALQYFGVGLGVGMGVAAPAEPGISAEPPPAALESGPADPPAAPLPQPRGAQ